MFNGKMKAVTFSYDDGITQDQRFIDLLNKYGLKGTFNINSGLCEQNGSLLREDVTVAHVRPRACELRRIYEGHEVAAHTCTHRFLVGTPEQEIIDQVENDRLALSEIMGYEVVGFAYPGGGINHDARAAKIIRENTGVKYARTTDSSFSFDLQDDLFEFKPTVYHHVEFDKMIELGEKFISLKPDKPQLFYIWGHAYEFDVRPGDWDRVEEFFKLISGHDDIFYGTNREVLLGE
ncbi:MAG: polysaccharide deacetylase family protein [Clostridia bacterium]|nr:polysaccharide deacetylase family protein [Clostridia bacterium]